MLAVLLSMNHLKEINWSKAAFILETGLDMVMEQSTTMALQNFFS